MALIVEDGTGLSTAESYISVVDASTYHSSRGNTVWAALATDAIREQLLRKATDYMIGEYSHRFNGYRLLTTQALDFPRQSLYLEAGYISPVLLDSNVVPNDVKYACAELALKAYTTTLSADQETAIKRERIYDAVEVEYADFASSKTKYTAIDNMLKPYLNSSSSAFYRLEAV